MKFDDRPFIAIWEMTQACDLVCLHCRACAQPLRNRDELSTQEGKALLDQFAEARVPLVVLTGGDPAKRPDLLELVSHGAGRGLHMGLTPSATPLVTEELIRDLARAGLSRLAVSIDGPNAEIHDAFRGVRGTFAAALDILKTARACGIATQINSTVHRGSLHHLKQMSEIVAQAGSILWSVFYVVPTGRAQADMLPSAEEVERSLEELVEMTKTVPFSIKTTAAPHYRRVLIQQRKKWGVADHGVHGAKSVRVNDGRGFLFVSHRGEVFPSGFLPVSCGNVRTENPLQIYREHPTFLALRDTEQLTGKCGACEFKNVCGGSRARAYALSGELQASDSLCSYIPPNYTGELDERPVLRKRRKLDVLAS